MDGSHSSQRGDAQQEHERETAEPFDVAIPLEMEHPEEKEGKQIPEVPMESFCENDVPQSFFDRANIMLAIVPAVCGLFYGYNVGIVAVYCQFLQMGKDCGAYTGGPSACESAAFQDCKWFTNHTLNGKDGYCGWYDVNCRVLYPNSDEFGGTKETAKGPCLADSRCQWSYSDNECNNPTDLGTGHLDIFAGTLVFGGLVGCFFAKFVVTRLRSKPSFVLAGTLGIFAAVLYHVTVATNEYWVLIVGRFVMGFANGISTVASPLYVDQNGNPKYKAAIGLCFMLFVMTGIALASFVGLVLGQTVDMSSPHDQSIEGRMQGFVGVATLISLSVVCLGILIPESRVNFSGGDDNAGDIDLNPDEFTIRRMLPGLLMVVVIAGSFQLTGINVVVSYAPTIMGNLGLAPFVGNFIVMLWSALSVIISIPLSFYFSMRQMFISGSFIISLTFIFLCGIPVYPGVSNTNTRNGVAILGTMVFIFGWGAAVAPTYYVLMQTLFPLSFRPKAASFAQAMQFLFSLFVTTAYPGVSKAISGGAAGDQNRGQSVCFIIMGAIGLVCSIIEVFFLHPYDKRHPTASTDAP